MRTRAFFFFRRVLLQFTGPKKPSHDSVKAMLKKFLKVTDSFIYGLAAGTVQAVN